MPTRKIADLPREDVCMSNDHNPPTHVVWPDGVYEHVCSACGRKFRFTVTSPRYVAMDSPYRATFAPTEASDDA
jgi:hypothetical protein